MEYLKADGFDKAIIGVEIISERIVYDKQKMIEILMTEGMNVDDAIEYLEYNVFCSYVGEHTPIYVDLMNINEIENI